MYRQAYRQALAASREDSAQLLEEARQMQEAIRLSRLEHVNGKARGQEIRNQPTDTHGKMKRKAQEELSRDDTKTVRPSNPNHDTFTLGSPRLRAVASSSAATLPCGCNLNWIYTLYTNSLALAVKPLTSSSEARMAYPNGGIRITRTPGRQQAKNCVNLEDLVHREDLTSACVFSFFIDDEELLKYFPLSHSSGAPPVSRPL